MEAQIMFDDVENAIAKLRDFGLKEGIAGIERLDSKQDLYGFVKQTKVTRGVFLQTIDNIIKTTKNKRCPNTAELIGRLNKTASRNALLDKRRVEREDQQKVSNEELLSLFYKRWASDLRPVYSYREGEGYICNLADLNCWSSVTRCFAVERPGGAKQVYDFVFMRYAEFACFILDFDQPGLYTQWETFGSLL